MRVITRNGRQQFSLVVTWQQQVRAEVGGRIKADYLSPTEQTFKENR